MLGHATCRVRLDSALRSVPSRVGVCARLPAPRPSAPSVSVFLIKNDSKSLIGPTSLLCQGRFEVEHAAYLVFELPQRGEATAQKQAAPDLSRRSGAAWIEEGERHVGGLCGQFNLSQPVVSHHLALLRLGGIVDRRRQGKNNFYSLTDTGYRLSNICKGMVC